MYKFWDKITVYIWWMKDKCIVARKWKIWQTYVYSEWWQYFLLEDRDIKMWRENDNELKEWDIVYVSNDSEEDALKKKEERTYLWVVHERALTKYLVVYPWFSNSYKNNNKFDRDSAKYVVKKPIEERKEHKLMLTDSERKKVKDILAT